MLNNSHIDNNNNNDIENENIDEYDFNQKQSIDYSNSKLDTCLNDLVVLITRDFILNWMSKLIWEKEKEKCDLMIK